VAIAMAGGAIAAGLGRVTVLSALGEPLRADIDLVALERGEIESLRARIASPEAFQQAGIDYAAWMSSLRFEITQGADGRRVVRLASAQPVNDPTVDLLVELNWASGRLQRQFALLLDPPGYQPRGPAPAPVVRVPAPAPAVAPAASVSVAPGSVPAPVSAAVPAAATPPRPTAAQHVIRSGDSLDRIAASRLTDGVTVDQMVAALFRANPDAFINGNINLLREGRILDVPSAASVRAIDEQDARRFRIVQDEAWNVWRRSAGAGVAAPPANTPPGAAASAAPASAPAAPAAPAVGRVPARPGSSGAPADRIRLGGDEAAARAGAGAAGDDVVARERELRDLQSRLESAEKSIREMQALIRLRSEQLAQAQAAAQMPAPRAVEPATQAPVPGVAVVPPGPAEAVERPGAAATQPQAGAGEPPADGNSAAPAVPTQPRMPEPAPAQAAPAEDDSFGPAGTIAAALLALVVGLGGLLFWRRRAASRATQRLAAEDSSASTPAGASTFGAVGGQAVDTYTSGLSLPSGDPISQAGIGVIDTEEVDPLAEADVYMAYGRDTQAEEILREALHKAPGRHEVRGKLLELYAARKDARAFAAAAADLFVATQGVGADWERAAALGAQLDPGNPMYRGGEAPGPVAGLVPSPAPQAPAVAPGGDATVGAPSISSDISRGLESAAARDLIFDLDLGEAPAPGSSVMDLDLSPRAGEGSRPPSGGLPAGGDFVRDGQASPGVVTSSGGISPGDPKAPNSLDLGSIDLDLGPMSVSTPTESDARWQETATKLDLARVYHDMGHHDDARELLGEVLREGDSAQQAQARKLLDNLG
jgi:pilus assembly protein FimV